MPSALPHSAQIRADIASYLKEAREVVADCARKVGLSGAYRNIYRTCLATDSVLQKLTTSRERPRLTVARGLIQRVPLLVAVGQVAASHSELRRFIEVVVWCVYFTDHPVEWQTFTDDPVHGFAKDIATPITFCAFRERAFYSNYAEELFKRENSGVASAAAKELSLNYGKLNAKVHPAHAATTKNLKPAWDSLTVSDLDSLAKMNRSVCANACIILAAYFRNRMERLPPVHRAWFDWLVGSVIAKRIRSGPFGL
jgi:hypothetical protein